MWFVLADSGFMEKIIHLLDVLSAAGWLMNLKMALMEHSDVTDPVCEFLRGANAYIQQRANICCLPDCESLCKSVTTTADVHGWGAQRHMRTGILTSGKNVRVPCLPFSDVGRIHGLIKKTQKTWPLNSREMCHVGAFQFISSETAMTPVVHFFLSGRQSDKMPLGCCEDVSVFVLPSHIWFSDLELNSSRKLRMSASAWTRWRELASSLFRPLFRQVPVNRITQYSGDFTITCLYLAFNVLVCLSSLQSLLSSQIN